MMMPGQGYAPLAAGLLALATAACAGSPSGLDRVPATAWTQVSAGHEYSCGITEDQVAYCWANRPWTDLPYDTLAERLEAKRVPGIGPVRNVAVGSASSCAESVAGGTFCWGLNALGQLGIGSFETHVALPVGMAGGQALRSVQLAESYGCGLDAEGRAYCWGRDHTGLEPGAVQPCPGYPDARCAPSPAAVPGGLRFTAISSANYHTCALTGSREAFCWGLNGDGSFGNGTDADSRTPVRAAGELRLSAVAAGEQFTCGLDAAGKAYCWGNNNDGQLGSPLRPEQRDPRCDYGPCSLAPVPVAGGHRFVALAAGGEHACAISTTQRLYCWGSNFSQQLADERAGRDRCGYYNHVPCSRRPVPVLRHLRFRAVSAGENRTCAITTAGNLFCWGGASPRLGPSIPPVDGSPRRIQPAAASGAS